VSDIESQDQPGEAPDLSLCWVVDEVAPGSPAEQLQLKPGDLLVSLGDSPMSEVTPRVWESCSRFREYRFYLPARALFRSSTAPSPLGLRASPTPALIVGSLDPKAPLIPRFFQLWQKGAYQDLRRCCHRVLWPDHPLDPPAPTGLMRKFRNFLVGPPVKVASNTPLIALYGAALWELGQKAEGLQWMECFERDYMKSWTLDAHSLVHYYQALHLQAQGQMPQAYSKALEAYQEAPQARTRQLLERLEQPIPSLEPWLGQEFPLDFEFRCLLPESNADSVTDRLNRLNSEQMVVLVCLSHYRGNGPYNDLVRRYRGYRRAFPGQIGAFLVVTETAQRPPDRNHWFSEEDAALREADEMLVLFDPEGKLAERLQPRGSPHVLVLDRHGRVHYEGFDFDGLDWWQTRSRLLSRGG